MKKPETYYDTYSAAVTAVYDYVTSRGYTIDEHDWFHKVTLDGKPKADTSKNSHGISLFKNGKEQKKCLHISVYRMPMPHYTNDKFELVWYIS